MPNRWLSVTRRWRVSTNTSLGGKRSTKLLCCRRLRLEALILQTFRCRVDVDRHALCAVVPMTAIATGFFRFVEGFVGTTEQPGRIVVFADLGDANAGGNGQLLAFKL